MVNITHMSINRFLAPPNIGRKLIEVNLGSFTQAFYILPVSKVFERANVRDNHGFTTMSLNGN
jgi:hypothetical protein